MHSSAAGRRPGHPKTMVQRKTITALLFSIVLLGAAVGPVAAAPGDQSFFGNLAKSGDQGQDGIAADAAAEVAQLSGQIARARAATDIPILGDDSAEAGNATAYAQDATTAFNNNNKTIADIANANADASTKHDVWVVYFHDRDGGNVTRYVVADVSNNNYTNVRMLTPSEFNDTGRSQDHHLSLDWYASRNADEEIQKFTDKFGSGDHNISRSYGARMWAEYGSGVESDVLAGGGS